MLRDTIVSTRFIHVNMRTILASLLVFSFACLLGACGQKGPLKLPPQAPGAAAATQPTAKPDAKTEPVPSPAAKPEANK